MLATPALLLALRKGNSASAFMRSKGTCCGGSSSCSRFNLAAGGYTCVNDATTSSCLAEGELCLSLYEGTKGQCCGGSSSCSRFDLAAGGFTCVNEATTTSFPPRMLQ